MIKKWLLILRDFSHVLIKRNDKRVKDDKTGYPILLYLVFSAYYVTIFGVLGGFVNRMGYNLNGYLRENAIPQLLFSAFMFGSFIPLIIWIVNWLKPIPLPDDLPKNKYRWYAVIFILTFLSGFFLMPLVINSFNRIWPPNSFR